MGEDCVFCGKGMIVAEPWLRFRSGRFAHPKCARDFTRDDVEDLEHAIGSRPTTVIVSGMNAEVLVRTGDRVVIEAGAMNATVKVRP